MMLVAQVKTLNGQTLVALGQQAVGLTVGQISNLTGHDLVDPKVLASLGHVTGWNRGQSQALVNKLLCSNFTVSVSHPSWAVSFWKEPSLRVLVSQTTQPSTEAPKLLSIATHLVLCNAVLRFTKKNP